MLVGNVDCWGFEKQPHVVFVSSSKVLESNTFKAHSLWDPIMEYKQKRLAVWKKMLLSKGVCWHLFEVWYLVFPFIYLFISVLAVLVDVANWMEKNSKEFSLGWHGQGI